jgi:hypothetical protein
MDRMVMRERSINKKSSKSNNILLLGHLFSNCGKLYEGDHCLFLDFSIRNLHLPYYYINFSCQEIPGITGYLQQAAFL